MKNLFLFLSLTLIFNNNYAQNSPSEFWADQCKFSTDGSGKSLGLKINFFVPCLWRQVEGERPHVIKNFKYLLTQSASLNETITLRKMNYVFPKDQVLQMFKLDKFKSLIEGTGTFVSSRKLIIDGLNCGEIIYKVNRQTPVASVYLYMIEYFLYYEDYTLIVLYGVGALTEKESKELFDKYKLLFQGLITKTVVISQWE